MQRCHIKLQTALKEGWGITITESNSQGTPAVVYDCDGLRDSVQHGKTGLITQRTPEALAEGIITMLTNTTKYNSMRKAAWNWSKQITFDQSYKDLNTALEAK